MQAVSFSDDFANMTYLGGGGGTAYDISGNVIVGSGTTVGVISSAGEVNYSGALASAAATEAGTSMRIKTVSRATTYSGTLITSHYLFGGTVTDEAGDTTGYSLKCTQPSFTGPVCNPVSAVEGPSNANLNIVSSAMTTGSAGCPAPPCFFYTSVDEIWLGSASLDGYADIFRGVTPFEEAASFHYLSSAPTLRGSVWTGADVVWHYGDEGLLIRCDNTDCVNIDLGNDTEYSFRDAYSYVQGLVLLGTKGSLGRLLFIPADAAQTDAGQYVSTYFGDAGSGDNLRALAGSLSAGLTVFGDASGMTWVVYRFALPE